MRELVFLLTSLVPLVAQRGSEVSWSEANGLTGFKTSSVPVLAISPAILGSEIEVQKKSKARGLRSLLEMPLGK